MKEWRVYAKAKPGQSPGIIINWPEWDEREAREWFKDHQTDKPGHFYEGMTLELVEFETPEERTKRERDRYQEALARIVLTLNQPGEPSEHFEKSIQEIAAKALGL